jgi:vacuolar-type H+-ATPase subunit E/Vma4
MDKSEDDKGKSNLIHGIQEDAQREAGRILKDAETYVRERQAAGEKKISSIMEEAKKKAEEQVNAVKRNMEAAITVEKRRIELRVRDRIIQEALEDVKKALYKMIDRPDYRKILIDWIVEAAIGLNVARAFVNASVKEKVIIDDKLLREAEEEIKKLTGKKVKLVRSKKDPLLAQGVVLMAENGKIAFNNQVPTRLLRYGSEIRRKIHETLFGDI